MTETLNLGLPLLAAGQAQKHVTVNEALARIDALCQITLRSVTGGVPLTPMEGDRYGVPAGATGDWAGQSGRVALFLNGGWEFLTPRPGWRAWVEDQGAGLTHDGTGWMPGVLSVSPHGAGAVWRVAEIDHTITAGATNTTVAVIPSHTLTFGVTARVVTPITGTLSTWQLGASDSVDRYGSGLGIGAGSWVNGVLSQPMAHWSVTPLVLTATGGNFSAGKVRFAVHFLELTLPGV